MTDRFKNPLAVAAWLALPEAEGGGGYRVGKSKLYADVKEGKLLPDDDGWFSLDKVKAYARKVGLPKAGPSAAQQEAAAVQDEVAARKRAAEAEDAEIVRDLRRIKYEREMRNLIPRADYDQAMADAAAILRDSGMKFFESKAREIIHLAGGDPRNEDKVLAFCKDHFTDWLHGFSRPVEHVVGEGEDEDKEAA